MVSEKKNIFSKYLFKNNYSKYLFKIFIKTFSRLFKISIQDYPKTLSKGFPQGFSKVFVKNTEPTWMGLEKRGGILGQAEGNGLWNVVECGGPVCPFLLYSCTFSFIFISGLLLKSLGK